MKLKTGAVNRAPVEILIDDAKFYIRPLNGEMYTTFSLFIGEYTDSMLSLRDKRNFIKQHIVDWDNLKVDNNGKEEVVEFALDTALTLLLDEDADEVLTILYSESLRLRQELDSKKVKDAEKAKK